MPHRPAALIKPLTFKPRSRRSAPAASAPGFFCIHCVSDMIKMPAPFRSANPDVAAALKECRQAFTSVAIFSGVANMIMLAGPLYMLQVYDRVLASRSVPTLVALSLFLVIAYAFQGGLDVVRSRLVVRIASMLDLRLERSVYDSLIRLANQNRNSTEAHQPVRDLDQIRSFLTGPGPTAIVDLPWTPIFLAICFLIHPWLGVAALAGAIVLLVFTILTERRSREPARAMAQSAGARFATAELTRRSSETVVGHGHDQNAGDAVAADERPLSDASTQATDVTGSFGSATKVIRMLLQSAILGIGAYLVIRQELSAGAMIAASIMMGRALAPIEIAIGNWRSLISARQSLLRLSNTLGKSPANRSRTNLPRPMRRLDVEHVAVAAPGGSGTILSDVHFGLIRGRGARRCRTERRRQDIADPHIDGGLARRSRQDPARWRRARAMGRGHARLPRWLCVPACRVLRGHDC